MFTAVPTKMISLALLATGALAVPEMRAALP